MSYKLQSLIINNFLSYENSSLDFDKNVNVVVGYNNDDYGQESNGSGKSSIVEAIYFAISGKSLRGIPVKKLIRKDQKSANIELTIIGKDKIVIKREIFEKSSTSCVITVNGENIPVTSQDDATNWILNKLNIFDKDDLLNSYIVTRNSHDALCQAKESKKREIILRLSNASKADTFLENARKHLKQINESINSIELSRERILGSLDLGKSTLFSYEQNLQNVFIEHESFKEVDLVDFNNKINQISSNINSILLSVESKKQLKNNLKNEIFDLEESKNNINKPKSIIGDNYEYSEEILDVQNDLKSIDLEIEEQKNFFNNNIYEKQKELSQLDIVFKKNKRLLEIEILESLNSITIKEKELNSNFSISKKEISLSISSLQSKKNQLIECPKCGLKHLINDNDQNIETKLIEQIADLEEKLNQLEIDHENEILKINELKQSENLIYGEKMAVIDLEYSRSKETLNKDIDSLNETKNVTLDGFYKLKKETSDILELLKNDFKILIENEKKEYLMKINLIDEKINNKKRKIDQYDFDISQLEKEIQLLKNNGQKLKIDIDAKENSIVEKSKIIESNIKSVNETINKINLDLLEINRERDNLLVHQSTAQLWVNKFNEFKGWLCRRMLDTLSSLISDRLSRAGSDLSIKFEGFRILSNGSLKDEVSLTIFRDGLPIGQYETLSSGEKARVDLATLLAMLDLSTSGSNGLHLIALDEVLDSVDLPGTRGLVEMLSKTNYQVLMISQHELEGTTSKIFKAVKKNKITTIK